MPIQDMECQLARSKSYARPAALVSIALIALVTVFSPSAWAWQDNGEVPPAEPAATEPDDPAPAEPAPAPAAEAPESADNGTSEVVATENYFEWMARASGMFGIVLLLLSFIMVALIMWNLLQVRREVLLPSGFLEEFEQRLNSKDFNGALEIATADDSFVARVLAGGLARVKRGYQEMLGGMQEVGEDENMMLEHRLSYLALIGSVAPMIGLMGTVYGMINSFRTIANSPTQPRPDELADGISTALFTTLEGLMVAIPAIVFYGLLRNRLARYSLEVGIVSENLMSRFASVGKRSSASTPSSPPPTPPVS